MAQTSISSHSEEENLFLNNRYAVIWTYYEDLLKKDSLNADLNYKMGICYLNSRSQKEKSIPYFKKALSTASKENVNSSFVFKSLAEACYLASNFDQAITNYEKYKEALLLEKKNGNEIEKTTQKIEMCKMARELKELKELFASLLTRRFASPEKNNVNISNKQYLSSSSSDQSSLILTFRLPLSNKGSSQDEGFFEDNIDSNLSTLRFLKENRDTAEEIKEATIATSVDGQIILIYRNEKGVCNLYASHLLENNWSTPEKLNKIINTKGWEPNEFISADGNTLYFSSDRPGGFGGKDIYRSNKLPSGEWGKAINLGPSINTPYDDEAPFIHPDGVTLYFSSKKNKTNQSFNIYTSHLSDRGTWSEVTDIGYPLTKPNKIASAPETNSKNTKFYSEKDNYIATFPGHKKVPITLIKGKIIDKNGKIPEYIEITVTNNENGEITGIFNSGGKTGQYLFILPPGTNNTVTYTSEGYLFHSENINISADTNYYRLNKTIELSPIIPGSQEMLNAVLFNEGKISFTSDSNVELNTLANFLIKNPDVLIEIFTIQNKGTSGTELKLWSDKLLAVKDFLLEKGINNNRIETHIYKKSGKRKKKEVLSENETGKIGIKIISIK